MVNVLTSVKLILTGFCSDRQLEIFNKFHNRFDRAVQGMFKLCSDQTRRCQTTAKQEFQGIGKAFNALGSAMEQDGIESK